MDAKMVFPAVEEALSQISTTISQTEQHLNDLAAIHNRTGGEWHDTANGVYTGEGSDHQLALAAGKEFHARLQQTLSNAMQEHQSTLHSAMARLGSGPSAR
ncbi:hypothetical protein [Amycolatopsis sp. H20-H5]|uniref:hypothetical protein n=1 Tax=Amycolatopsis sp. H20-H5 TaxID=3046309 RepID=UPI002DB64694|nr:hypothetical protein [Amycolatopsis sp. H20-H5]MEC3982621.1 hypothetical protein [Amycolatopsis sp. H20-H5]